MLQAQRALGTAKMDATSNGAAGRKRKLTALPILIVLFVISYSLLTRLVIEQDKTIDAQRTLIHLLFDDNIALTKLHRHSAVLPRKFGPKGDIAVEFSAAGAAKPKSQSPSSQVPPSATQSARVPGQIESNQVKSIDNSPDNPAGKADAHAHSRVQRKLRRKAPRPPAEITDPSDTRRVLFSI
jgi:hypothetical protein